MNAFRTIKAITLTISLLISLDFSHLSFALDNHQSSTAIANQSLIRAKKFIRSRLTNTDLGLECITIGAVKCPVKNTGQIFTLNHIVYALKSELTKEENNYIKNTIMKQKNPIKWLWGYDNTVFLDADDTAYALQALFELRSNINANDLKIFYNQPRNAYTTFVTPDHIKPTISNKPSPSNNYSIHPDINANVFYLLFLLQKNNLINYGLIVKSQSSDGSWDGYIYPGKYFSTYLSMRLLCSNYAMNKSSIEKGLYFITSAQKNGGWGDSLNTALALNSLLTCRSNNKEIIKNGINYLIQKQSRDGSFNSSLPIWMYVYNDNPINIWAGYDNNRVLTTALAAQALYHYLILNDRHQNAAK